MNAALWFILALVIVQPAAAADALELVLYEGARLTARTPSGVVSVLAGSGIARKYEWNGCSLDSHMVPRTSRWYGSLGIYDPAPGDGSPFSTFRRCKGVSRMVVEEGQLHFADMEAAQAWIRRYAGAFPTVWSGDGLVVH